MIKYFIYIFLTTILCIHACIYTSYDFCMLENGTNAVYFYQYCSSTVKNSFVRAHICPSSRYQKGDSDYLKKIADTFLNKSIQLIFPDNLEIIRGPGGWGKGSLTVNLYQNNKLIANNIHLVGYYPATINELMHIKSPEHHLTKNFRPVELLNTIQKITYHNGWYPEEILIYPDKVDEPHSLKPTWQHNLVRIITCSLMGIIFYYVASKCGATKLFYK